MRSACEGPLNSGTAGGRAAPAARATAHPARPAAARSRRPTAPPPAAQTPAAARWRAASPARSPAALPRAGRGSCASARTRRAAMHHLSVAALHCCASALSHQCLRRTRETDGINRQACISLTHVRHRLCQRSGACPLQLLSESRTSQDAVTLTTCHSCCCALQQARVTAAPTMPLSRTRMLPGWQSAWNSLARAPVSARPTPAPELDSQHQGTHRTTRAQAPVNPRSKLTDLTSNKRTLRRLPMLAPPYEAKIASGLARACSASDSAG
jgi:hypothetical protein